MTRPFQHAPAPLWAYKALLLAAATIWGLGTVVIKTTVDTFPPAWLVGVRFTAAGVVLGVALLPRLKRTLDLDHLRKGAALGAMLFLSYWSNSTGLTDTTASNSAFLTSLYCVIIPFLGWALRGPRPTRCNIAAALACVAGVGCVSFAGASGFSLGFGDLVTLLSALFLGFHVLYTARFAPGCDMAQLTVVQFLVAGALGLAAGVAFEPMPNFLELGPDTWASLAYLAVFASCIALLLQNIAVAHVDPAPASLFLATESVFGATFSVAFLNETLGPLSLAGFALIFAGIVTSEYIPLRTAKRAAARSAPDAAAEPSGENL
ncbi:EamA family transporter [Gordonibacter sp. An230]|uniref:DMT family transporter n=1 Tax=Gordonibacter sp. An230 TaxID=1965592 RepID=UPI000B3AE68B|nr:DMT family transporter [Gordonibacter sp. An230]OUO89557.1 EamA family transporter [Gordonibacter sp. An230]